VTKEPILAIVGAAEAPGQDEPTATPAGLMAGATAAALAQTTLRKEDIDGLFSGSAYYYMPTLTLADYLGIRPRWSDSSLIGGSSFVMHLGHAAAGIAAGAFEVGLIAYGSTQQTDGARYVRSMSEVLAYDAPYAPHWPIAGYAMMAQRHMHEYGTTPEQLAEVAVAAREWAVLNPDAPATERITVEDVLASPEICSPLHRLDCCLVTNAGAALIVTSPERAREVCENPVYVLAEADTHFNRHMSTMPDFTSSPAAETGPRALAQAGLTLDDIDVVQIYDSFTIATIVALEDLGFCAKGEGGPFVEDGKLRPGGSLPLNTGGGGLSYRHGGMLGTLLLVEAVTQLRGQGGPRQVEGAQTALVHGLGGVHMSGATAVLVGPDWV
jgi:acetyl-CoA acetyltransferase